MLCWSLIRLVNCGHFECTRFNRCVRGAACVSSIFLVPSRRRTTRKQLFALRRVAWCIIYEAARFCDSFSRRAKICCSFYLILNRGINRVAGCFNGDTSGLFQDLISSPPLCLANQITLRAAPRTQHSP